MPHGSAIVPRRDRGRKRASGRKRAGARKRGSSQKRSGARNARASEGATTARPVWSGSLSFGLVNVPVDLYSAQRPGGVGMRMLGPDGAPLARQYVCPEEDEPLERDEIVRGYEVAKGKYVTVTDEDLEKLAPRRSRDIDLELFAPRDEIDPSFFVRTYYLVPAGEQAKAYRLLAEVLEETERAGIGRFVMRDKAYAVAIFADRGILRAQTLRFGDEVRDAGSLRVGKSKKVEGARLRKMEKALEGLAKKELAEGELRDEEPERLLELAREKRARGEDVVEVEVPDAEPRQAGAEEEGGEVIDLVALLKQRLAAKGGGGRTKRSTSGGSRSGRSASRSAKRKGGARRRSASSRRS